MEKKSYSALTGKQNKRLKCVRPTNSEGTAAWQDPDGKIAKSNVTVPTEYGIDEAKDWVDNGSKL